MSEGMMVTPLGHRLLTQKKEQLEKIILEAQEGLADLNQGDPGDGFQDGYLLETQTNIQIMANRLREIRNLLTEAVLTTEPQHKDTVTLGHKVWLTLVYPSGESETLAVVLTGSPELSLVEEHLQNGEVPISPISALGQAILDKKVGATFDYPVENGVVQGQLLKIEIWQPAFLTAALS